MALPLRRQNGGQEAPCFMRGGSGQARAEGREDLRCEGNDQFVKRESF